MKALGKKVLYSALAAAIVAIGQHVASMADRRPPQ